jgi:hypothetical protein
MPPRPNRIPAPPRLTRVGRARRWIGGAWRRVRFGSMLFLAWPGRTISRAFGRCERPGCWAPAAGDVQTITERLNASGGIVTRLELEVRQTVTIGEGE